MATFWTAIGSVGTFITAVIAYWTLRNRLHHNRESEAAVVREHIRAFVSAAHKLADELCEGSPMITAAWDTANALRARAGEPADADALRAILGTRSPVQSAAIEGWHSSAASAEFHRLRRELRSAGQRLPGYLNALSESGDLLDRITQKGFSATRFADLLAEPHNIDPFLSEHSTEQDSVALTRAIASYLQERTSQAFTDHYEPTVKELVKFVDDVAAYFTQRDAVGLLRISRAKAPPPAQGSGRIEQTFLCLEQGCTTLPLWRRLLRHSHQIDRDLTGLTARAADLERVVSEREASEPAEARPS